MPMRITVAALRGGTGTAAIVVRGGWSGRTGSVGDGPGAWYCAGPEVSNFGQFRVLFAPRLYHDPVPPLPASPRPDEPQRRVPLPLRGVRVADEYQVPA